MLNNFIQFASNVNYGDFRPLPYSYNYENSDMSASHEFSRSDDQASQIPQIEDYISLSLTNNSISEQNENFIFERSERSHVSNDESFTCKWLEQNFEIAKIHKEDNIKKSSLSTDISDAETAAQSPQPS